MIVTVGGTANTQNTAGDRRVHVQCDEDQKEKLEELTTAFEQRTEWLKEVQGDNLQLTSKELVNIGDENRVRTIGHVDERNLQSK